MFALGLSSFLKSYSRLIRLAKKPDRTEVWITIKVCTAGIILVGLVGFTINILSTFIRGAFPTSGTTTTAKFIISIINEFIKGAG
jgi:protein translocase SEC61 complex gamma subunit